MSRAGSMAGRTLAELAGKHGIRVPDTLRTQKGWVGELMETLLGTDAGTRPEPDFTSLGIELKTLPLNDAGKVQESTFVCTAPLINPPGQCWENSPVRRKLNTVLWIPVEADHGIPLGQRRIGNPMLWQPDADQESVLRQDYEDIMTLIQTGQLDRISAGTGRYLQLRPKAANARSLCEALDADGNPVRTLPRGFYLRARFTNAILQEAYLT